MCIRDSAWITIRLWTHFLAYNPHMRIIGRKTVSYTHLDGDKRQVVDRNRQIAALEQRGGRLSDAFASRDVHRDERAGDAVERSRRNQLGRARQEAKRCV